MNPSFVLGTLMAALGVAAIPLPASDSRRLPAPEAAGVRRAAARGASRHVRLVDPRLLARRRRPQG